MHGLIHLIPQRSGDVRHPKGGIRGVIPGKAQGRLAVFVPLQLALLEPPCYTYTLNRIEGAQEGDPAEIHGLE